MQRIRFCARGPLNSTERNCFALSFTQHATNSAANYQCHVFRCQQAETAGKALLAFGHAFRNMESVPTPSNPPSASPSPSAKMFTSSAAGGEENYEFESFLEIKVE